MWNFNKYRFKKIITQKKENLSFGYQAILLPPYNIGVSDATEKNPNGNSYNYETDNNFKKIDLCCNESAVDFCEKNHSLIYYNDFLNNGKLRVLTPETLEINKNLQNVYLCRSIYF